MALYVHVNPDKEPYLDRISFEETEGYVEKEYLEPDQMVTLMYATDKCYLDKNGNIVVPNIQPPLSDTEVKLQQAEMQITMMQHQFSNLILSMAKGGNK